MDITTTAATIQQAQGIVQGAQAMAAQSNWGHVALAAVLGTLAGVPAQAIIEHWLAGPRIPAAVKAAAPAGLALGLGYLATRFGVSPEQATTAATLLATAAHVYNEMPMAAVTAKPDAPVAAQS